MVGVDRGTRAKKEQASIELIENCSKKGAVSKRDKKWAWIFSLPFQLYQEEWKVLNDQADTWHVTFKLPPKMDWNGSSHLWSCEWMGWREHEIQQRKENKNVREWEIREKLAFFLFCFVFFLSVSLTSKLWYIQQLVSSHNTVWPTCYPHTVCQCKDSLILWTQMNPWLTQMCFERNEPFGGCIREG